MITPDELTNARRNLGQQLAAMREAVGLTQVQLARHVGYTRSTIANVETGRSSQPRDCWVRYDHLLRADGALLVGYDQYRALVSRYRDEVAQERERQRAARFEQWRHAHAAVDADGHAPARVILDRQSGDGQARPTQPIPVDPDRCKQWYEMLRVLAAAGNVFGVPGLLDVVRNEITIIDRHRRAADGPLRRTVAAAQARWLEFGSWIADNYQQPETAAGWLRTARSLADEAGDRVSAGYVQMRQAQQAIEAADPARSAALAEPVMQDGGLPPRVRALAAVRHAQALAHDRNPGGVRASLGLAYHLVDQASRAEDPAVTAMAGHATSAYVRGYEAHCRLLLGDPSAAAHDLQLVLTEWPAAQQLDEGLFRANLAVALARSGQLEAAKAEAAEARTLGRHTGSWRTLALLNELAEASHPREEARTR